LAGGSRVYVTNNRVPTVSVISAATGTITNTIPVHANPDGLAVSPDGTKVYVANNGANNVSVIATATNAVTATVTVGSGPQAFGIFIAPAPQVQYSPCDLLQTGIVTVADVQLIINEALGVAPPTYILSGGTTVGVVDVQIEINAALGLGCSAK
jgi:YVTN family beta-propeller protein